jgi:hypothetical protein
VTTKSGNTARVSNGHVTSIHTAHGATITRGPHGSTRVVSERRGGGRLVNSGRHGYGYGERGYRGRDGGRYMGRTYYRGGHYYAYGYRGGYYHGGYYYGYVPAYYYGPAFYGWAYNPWAAPVVYSWGWGGAPWFGYYGYYFNPYPAYATAALWMTDYVISQNLQAAYEAQAAANANAAAAQGNGGGQQDASNGGGGGGVALTPEVKQAIADEVKAQLAAEQSAAQAPQPAAAPAAANTSADANPPEEVPAALDPNHRTFIVSDVLNETGPDGADCSLSAGDVVTRIDDTPDANKNVKVLVSASQKSDCASGSQVAVSVDDLQEMHNHFREQLDSGLKTLADNQGKNGLPAAPDTKTKPNPDGQVKPDTSVKDELAAQQADADKAEADVQSDQAAAPSGQGND